MNDEQKKAFLDLPLNEQLLAILDSLTFIRQEVNTIKTRQQNFEDDTRMYRRLREINEDMAKGISH